MTAEAWWWYGDNEVEVVGITYGASELAAVMYSEASYLRLGGRGGGEGGRGNDTWMYGNEAEESGGWCSAHHGERSTPETASLRDWSAPACRLSERYKFSNVENKYQIILIETQVQYRVVWANFKRQMYYNTMASDATGKNVVVW